MPIIMMKNIVLFLFFVSLFIISTSAQNPPAKKKGGHLKWKTLNGQQPLVIAQGGFSGLYPESIEAAYLTAIGTSLPDVALSCNVQLTKDNGAICAPDIRLDNSTNIADTIKQPQKSHDVYGKNLNGWFSIDFAFQQLFDNVNMVQSVLSRTAAYDGIYGVSDPLVLKDMKAPKIWLNFQYDLFYTQNKLSVAQFLQDSMTLATIDYASCPEVGFFKTLKEKLDKNSKMNLIFKFPEDINAIEPTTKKPYSSILDNLAEIKSFASGILVPKGFIWTVNSDRYLNGSTTLVMDAHKEGLEVYAYGFANDFPLPHNYSYDPVAEYLKFIDNSQFSVDGFLTDFPSTASEAVACFALNKKNASRTGKGIVISKNGASGVYPACTDLAYEQALTDGADVIDCSVQMTKDGTLFCLDSEDLTGSTNVMTSPFVSRVSTIPEIKPNSSIYSFDLTWSEVQSLKPQIMSPYAKADLIRNPSYKNAGKLITLPEFLELAKKKAAGGVLINIENAHYLATKSLDVIDAVNTALSKASLDKNSTQKVFIQSDDSSVLSKFKNNQNYQKILTLPGALGGAPKPAVDEIKKHADGVDIKRKSILPPFEDYTGTPTGIVKELQAANLSVYVSGFRNEFTNIAVDLFSDPMVELATYFEGFGVDGVSTEFPATANRYLRSPCADPKGKRPYTIHREHPGEMYKNLPAQPPSFPPSPSLKVADVVDPPMPEVAKDSNKQSSSSPKGAPGSPNSKGVANGVNGAVSFLAVAVLSLLLMGY